MSTDRDMRDGMAKAMCAVETRSKAATLDEVQAGIQRWMRHRWEAESLITELADYGLEVRPRAATTDAGRAEYTIAAESQNGAITQLGDYTTVVRDHLIGDLVLFRQQEEALGGNPDRIFIAQRPIPEWVRS